MAYYGLGNLKESQLVKIPITPTTLTYRQSRPASFDLSLNPPRHSIHHKRPVGAITDAIPSIASLLLAAGCAALHEPALEAARSKLACSLTTLS